MSKKVQTGCPNCRRCTNSHAGEAGRKAGRASTALATGGLTEVARLGTRNCRACGHKVSLHTSAAQVASTVSVSVPVPAANWGPDFPAQAARQRATADEADAEAAKVEAKAEEWDAKASGYEGTFNGKMRASNARKTAERLRKAARANRQRAENLRGLTDAAEVTPAQPIEPTPALPAASAPDFTEQLVRLAELRATGVLSEDEFAAAKARLLADQ